MTRTLADLEAIHAKQAAWLARHPGHPDRQREHAALGAQIAALRAAALSYPVTRSQRRPSRRTRHIPDRPAGGYHVTQADTDPVSPLAGMDHAEAIAQAVADLDALDERIRAIDAVIDACLDTMESGAVDAWDRDDTERTLADLTEQRSVAWWQAVQTASLIHAHGGYLIDGGQGDQLDAIGAGLSCTRGALACVATFVPGVLTGFAWQRLIAAAEVFTTCHPLRSDTRLTASASRA